MSNGSLSIRDSIISGNGGGVTGGVILLLRTTISGNRDAGVRGEEFLTIENCTISDNQGSGVQIVGASPQNTIADSTITGNSATRGGGIDNLGHLTLSRTIVAGNTASTSGAEIANGGTMTANNFNLIGVNGIAGIDGNASLGPTDIIPALGVVLSDILNPLLVDNSGPTPTHELIQGGPAIDAIPVNNPGCTATDQRGFLALKEPTATSALLKLGISIQTALLTISIIAQALPTPISETPTVTAWGMPVTMTMISPFSRSPRRRRSR
jgi:hypothetical protein